MKHVVLFFLRVYQKYLSPLKGAPTCRSLSYLFPIRGGGGDEIRGGKGNMARRKAFAQVSSLSSGRTRSGPVTIEPENNAVSRPAA